MARKKLPQIEVGSLYGYWTVIREGEPRKYINHNGNESLDPRWICKCRCGTERSVMGSSLKSGRSKTCGCSANVKNLRHGMHRTTEYRIWSGMIERCHNPKNKKYNNYGGKGIHVCEAWKSSFACFYADMGARPSLIHSIDRIDGRQGYSKRNCRWATNEEQNFNKSNNHLIPFKGEMQPYTKVAREIGMKPATLEKRLRLGWSAERAISQPVNK